ncbi:MAG: PepSY domain-containing protein [Bifidobacteriaceae bacterium]|nr:PepSY domain-containing protein [Bifidobacteriaceae bacterium]
MTVRGLASAGLAAALVVAPGIAALASPTTASLTTSAQTALAEHRGDHSNRAYSEHHAAVPAAPVEARSKCGGWARKCISRSAAKKKALKHARVGSKGVRVTKIELDWDDGRLVYEIDFYKGRWEYDYEINAKNGRILSAERESIYD